MDRNKLPLDPRQLGVPSGASKMISNPIVCLAQTVHLSCTDTNTVMEQTKRDSTWATSPRSSIVFVQNDFQAFGMFGATHAPILHRHWHRFQTNRNKICLGVPRPLGVPLCASKMVAKPMHVRCKQCTYLASRLALSPNGPKQGSNCASSPQSTSGCVQNDY
jgi:hypothetical protein